MSQTYRDKFGEAIDEQDLGGGGSIDYFDEELQRLHAMYGMSRWGSIMTAFGDVLI